MENNNNQKVKLFLYSLPLSFIFSEDVSPWVRSAECKITKNRFWIFNILNIVRRIFFLLLSRLPLISVNNGFGACAANFMVSYFANVVVQQSLELFFIFIFVTSFVCCLCIICIIVVVYFIQFRHELETIFVSFSHVWFKVFDTHTHHTHNDEKWRDDCNTASCDIATTRENK